MLTASFGNLIVGNTHLEPWKDRTEIRLG